MDTCSKCGSSIPGLYCMNTDCPTNQKVNVLSPMNLQIQKEQRYRRLSLVGGGDC